MEGISSSTVTVNWNTPGERWKFCPKCGAKLEDGWNFCSSCGQRIGALSSPTQGYPYIYYPYTYPYPPYTPGTADPMPMPYVTTWTVQPPGSVTQ